MSNIKSLNSSTNTATNSGKPSATQIGHLLKQQQLHHQRSTSSPSPPASTHSSPIANNQHQNNNSSNSNSGSTTPSSTPTSPISPISSIDNNSGAHNPLKTSYEQLRDTLLDYEFDGEVIIKDVSEEDELFADEDSYESFEEEGSYDDDANVPDDNSSTNSSIIEEEEEELKSPSSTTTTRAYSYTIASAKPDIEIGKAHGSGGSSSPGGSIGTAAGITLSRHERSESTIIHPDVKPSIVVSANVGGSPARVPSSGSLKLSSGISKSPHKVPVNGGSLRSTEKANQFKEAISSEYKKMLDNPDEFRAQKLKQRKSKFFTKEDIANFHPSSGTQMKSKFYKQFIEEKLSSIHDNVEKYKSDLIKNYIMELNTTRSSGPITFNNLKPITQLKPASAISKDKEKKIQRNRSYSQPADMSSAPKTPMGMTLESVIARENNRDSTNRKIPLLVSKCIDFLWVEKVLDTEGLFRVGGNQSEVETLMKSLLQHGFDIPTDCCVHVVSSTLKKFLRQLSVPVFTFKYHNDFIKALKLNDNEKSPAVKKLILDLPEYNQCLIKELMRFLVDVTRHSTKNMMHAHNLGLMFGPSLMKSPDENVLSIMLDSSSQVITHILENYNQIFDDVEHQN